jgi:hypothetical protein
VHTILPAVAQRCDQPVGDELGLHVSIVGHCARQASPHFRCVPAVMHPVPSTRWRWIYSHRYRPQNWTMQPDLTDHELETAARACRALAHCDRESAETIRDPSLRTPVQKRAECAAALTERFEKTRRRATA